MLWAFRWYVGGLSGRQCISKIFLFVFTWNSVEILLIHCLPAPLYGHKLLPTAMKCETSLFHQFCTHSNFSTILPRAAQNIQNPSSHNEEWFHTFLLPVIFLQLSCVGSKLRSKRELRCCRPADTKINNITVTNSI